MKFVVLKVLDKNGAGYTSDVIRAIDFAVANRDALRHRHHQPVARTSDLRAGGDRSARAGGRARHARRHHRRRRRRQPRQESEDRPSRLRRHHVARQRAVGDHRRRGARRTTPSRAATIGFRTTAPPARRGTTPCVKPDVVAPGHNIVADRREARDAVQDVSAAEGGRRRLHAPERHEHGDGGDDRRRSRSMLEAHRAAHPYAPDADAERWRRRCCSTPRSAFTNDLGIEYDPLGKGAGALNAKGAIDLGAADRHLGAGRIVLADDDAVAVDDDRRRDAARGTRASSGAAGSSGAARSRSTRRPGASAIIWGSTTRRGAAASSGAATSSGPTRSRGSSGIIWGNDTIGETSGEGDHLGEQWRHPGYHSVEEPGGQRGESLTQRRVGRAPERSARNPTERALLTV